MNIPAKKRVLHIINTLNIGGAERLLYDIIKYINENHPSIEQHIVTLYESGELSKLVNPSIKVICLNARYPFFLLKSMKLNKIIRDNKIDIVHSHLFDSIFLSRIACPSNVRLVSTYHNSIYNPKSKDFSRLRLWLDKYSYRKHYQTIYVSHAVKNQISPILGITHNEHVIPNFADDAFLKEPRVKTGKGLKLISVGTLKYQKNHSFSLDVMKRLKGLDISLDIYGFGPYQSALEKQIRESDIKVNIYNDKIITRELLSEYDIFFMSSFYEGMSIALLEAMYAGLPVILSDIPSFKETAKDAGFFFDIKKEDSAFNTILHLYKNKHLLNELSQKSYILASEYLISKNVQKLLEIY